MDQGPQSTRERAVLLLRAALLPRWRLTASQGLIWVVRGIVLLVVIGLLASAVVPAVDKPLWAWLNLLIIPVVLGLGAYLFTRSENRTTRDQADHRREEDVLQAYLDQMWQLLLDKDLRSTSKANSNSEALTAARSEALTAARVSTLTTLERIHHSDKKRLIVTFFLWMSQCSLLKRQDTVVILEGANLAEADLHEVDLGGANLSGANLTSADLSDANFIRANLSGAYKVTDEKTKQPITNEELVQQTKFLEGATMPNGRKYENWLKIKRHRDRQHGENGGTS